MDDQSLDQKLARATGLPRDLAEAVLETARAYIKAQRPDLADQVDAMLADRRGARRVVRLIARLGRKADPRRSQD